MCRALKVQADFKQNKVNKIKHIVKLKLSHAQIEKISRLDNGHTYT